MKIPQLCLFLLILGSVTFSCKQRVYRHPSRSMENTIMMGQHFYVSASDHFERNDIVVFDYFGRDFSSPLEEPGQYKMHWEKRVFRIIALSGDSIEVTEGEVFVNRRHIALPRLAKLLYQVKSTVEIDDFAETDLYSAPEPEAGSILAYLVPLTQGEAEDYRKRKPAIVSVERKFVEFAENDTSLAKSSDKDKWSVDYYGPLKIPSPGEDIIVDDDNYKLYKNIPGIHPGQNTVKEKLYFVLGDNRDGAEDSRFTGFISHSKMNGVVK
jgi:signal peptidase I